MRPSSDDIPRPPIGVGIIGAGPVVQAIHLPTLARLRDLFTVRHVMDVSADVASSVAGRVGASWSTSVTELLADESVQVVAVCSPHQFHKAQVIDAMRAGKQAVLCEKPFAQTREEAFEIAAVSRETGVPVLVGAMHTFDPGWIAASENWGDLPRTAHTVRSRIVIPPNPRFEDWATEVFARPETDGAPPPEGDAGPGLLRGAVMGLAIHDLPLVRRFVRHGAAFRVDHADAYFPFGYNVGMHADDQMVQLSGHVTEHWGPSWTFEAFDDTTHLAVEFTPSYVHAGSAVATVTREGVATVHGPFPLNGYEGEWRVIHDVVRGDASRLPDLDDLVEDLTFAIDVADEAVAYLERDRP